VDPKTGVDIVAKRNVRELACLLSVAEHVNNKAADCAAEHNEPAEYLEFQFWKHFLKLIKHTFFI
jgi:hypothetical protein